MAISYLAAGWEAWTSISSMPTHAAGNFLVMIALRTDVSTPSLPAGWKNGGSGNGYRVGWKVAESASETSGTWNSASILFCHVYDGLNSTDPIGDIQVQSSTGQSMTYPALTLEDAGFSWAARAGYATVATTCPVVPTPTGFTRRNDGGDLFAYDGKSYDTNAATSSVAADGPTPMGPHSYPWRALSFELLADRGGALFWAFP